MIANVNEENILLHLDIKNFPTDDVQILRIDEENTYTLTGETLANGSLMLPENACVQIQLLDVS